MMRSQHQCQAAQAAILFVRQCLINSAKREQFPAFSYILFARLRVVLLSVKETYHGCRSPICNLFGQVLTAKAQSA